MSNFKCDKCGMTNIDCGLSVFKTPKEIELEKKLQIAEEALFFISTCVKIVKGYSLPIPTREACKAFEALQKIKEVNNENKKD